MSFAQFVCKICGRGYNETSLMCLDVYNDFFVCEDGFGCRDNSDEIFRNIYTNLYKNGRISFPRGLKVLEIENFNCEFSIYNRFVNFSNRNLNFNYIKKEFLWYLRGDKYDTSITKYAKMWNDFIEDDGSIYSNYGQYMFGDLKQIENVIDILINDKYSRRASVVILQPYHLLNKQAKEIPCTYAINFRIREYNNLEVLNMSVHMRSQDAWIGFASDIPCFSFIFEIVLNILKEKYPNIMPGTYYHCVDSFHLYEKHFEKVKDIVDWNIDYKHYFCPKIKNADEAKKLLKNEIDESYEFSKWLKKEE